MSNFRPDTRGAVVVIFLGSLVQSCCGEGGTLQTNNTGVCLQCFSHTGPAHAHSACALPCPRSSGSRLLCWEPSEASPGLHAPPRSKLLRFRHSGSPQRHRLGWACILCPSQVGTAQVMRCLASAVAATSPLPSLLLGFLGVQPVHLLRQMMTVQNPKKS